MQLTAGQSKVARASKGILVAIGAGALRKAN